MPTHACLSTAHGKTLLKYETEILTGRYVVITIKIQDGGKIQDGLERLGLFLGGVGRVLDIEENTKDLLKALNFLLQKNTLTVK